MLNKSVGQTTSIRAYNLLAKVKRHGIRESLLLFVNVLVSHILIKRSDRDFTRIAGVRRELLSRRVYQKADKRVLYGKFKGLKIVSCRWGLRDLGSIILGEYERDVVEYINNLDGNYSTFIDVGAADGYYAVGLLHNKKIRKAICFESSHDGRASIELNSHANGVGKDISIRGTATLQFANELLAELGEALQNCIFLFDIEGGEFDILTQDNLQILRNSILVVELHREAGDYEVKLSQLYDNAKDSHQIRVINRTGVNPFQFKELDNWPDEDRQIIFSEGRRYSMTWIALHPILQHL